jgi:hypothetical protein
MTDLLAVDPSIVSPGAALFRDGILIAAGRVKVVKTPKEMDRLMRALSVADVIASWYTERSGGGIAQQLAFEWPQIYADGKGKGDPNGLLAMVAVNAALLTAMFVMGATRGVQVSATTYKPADWIGQLPKTTRGKASASPRAQRIYSRLSDNELAQVPDQHDAIDAVGIGLHHLGRLGVRRAFSSGARSRQAASAP